MNVRNLIKPYLVEWPMSDKLDPLTFEINRLVSQLDDIALEYEAKWGMGQLEGLVATHNPALAEKFQRQMDKLAEALAGKDLRATRDLVDGFTRAYKALEADVKSRGYHPSEPVIFFCRCGSMVYKVVRTISQRKAVENGDRCVVMSCEELINFYHKSAFNAYCQREPDKLAISVDEQGFDWAKGDALPPEF